MKITMLDLLTVLFVGLKLTGYIDWSWFIVLLPQIMSLVAMFCIAFFRLDKTQQQKDAEDVQLLLNTLRKDKEKKK